MLEIEANGADAIGGAPVFTLAGQAAGRIRIGTYGHSVSYSLGLAMVKTDCFAAVSEFDVAVLGQPHRAKLLD